jgi:hypothetical protein
MAKDVKKATQTSTGNAKRGKAAVIVSAGFKKKFSQAEKADIGKKRQQMRDRLYATG